MRHLIPFGCLSCAPVPLRAHPASVERQPRPTLTGNGLHRAARLLSAAASVSGDPTLAQITLVTRLAALAEDIAGLREAQRHAAQAAAARQAAERLHAARCTRITPPPTRRATARTTGHRVDHEFPIPISAVLAAAAQKAHSPIQPNSRPTRTPGPPRPRGPTR
jgi:hypothetical protein